jgi:hypothetical protein
MRLSANYLRSGIRLKTIALCVTEPRASGSVNKLAASSNLLAANSATPVVPSRPVAEPRPQGSRSSIFSQTRKQAVAG